MQDYFAFADVSEIALDSGLPACHARMADVRNDVGQ